jgi:hypothetical protein
MYSLMHRRPQSFELLRRKLSDFILEEGGKLILDDSLKVEVFVVRLVELRESIIQVFHKAMNSDP